MAHPSWRKREKRGQAYPSGPSSGTDPKYDQNNPLHMLGKGYLTGTESLAKNIYKFQDRWGPLGAARRAFKSWTGGSGKRRDQPTYFELGNNERIGGFNFGDAPWKVTKDAQKDHLKSGRDVTKYRDGHYEGSIKKVKDPRRQERATEAFSYTEAGDRELDRLDAEFSMLSRLGGSRWGAMGSKSFRFDDHFRDTGGGVTSQWTEVTQGREAFQDVYERLQVEESRTRDVWISNFFQ